MPDLLFFRPEVAPTPRGVHTGAGTGGADRLRGQRRDSEEQSVAGSGDADAQVIAPQSTRTSYWSAREGCSLRWRCFSAREGPPRRSAPPEPAPPTRRDNASSCGRSTGVPGPRSRHRGIRELPQSDRGKNARLGGRPAVGSGFRGIPTLLRDPAGPRSSREVSASRAHDASRGSHLPAAKTGRRPFPRRRADHGTGLRPRLTAARFFISSLLMKSKKTWLTVMPPVIRLDQ